MLCINDDMVTVATTEHHSVYAQLHTGFPLFYWQKIQDFPGPHEKFSRTFWSPRMLRYKEKTFPYPRDPCPPSPSLPLEVGPFTSS